METEAFTLYYLTRGGGEYEEKWRDASSVQKQNVFDGFIAAAGIFVIKIYFFSFRVLIDGGLQWVYSG
jgi:prolyl oligopeptidase PreP (S9A serine peptidase family)